MWLICRPHAAAAAQNRPMLEAIASHAARRRKKEEKSDTDTLLHRMRVLCVGCPLSSFFVCQDTAFFFYQNTVNKPRSGQTPKKVYLGAAHAMPGPFVPSRAIMSIITVRSGRRAAAVPSACVYVRYLRRLVFAAGAGSGDGSTACLFLAVCFLERGGGGGGGGSEWRWPSSSTAVVFSHARQR